MTKRLLIDARQAEETRVVLLSGTRIEDFDYETENRKQLKGNVYLARVTRVEPSLQAAFVEYGGNRQGFLAFSEIHPDYYRIPIEDREALIEANSVESDDDSVEAGPDGTPETLGGEETDEEDIRAKRQVKRYKIQEVISRKQIMLVQVVKEERGNCLINTLSKFDSRTWLAGERQVNDKTPINRCTPGRRNAGGAAKRNTH